MKVDVYNHNNEKVGTVEVSDKVFALKWNPDLVHQALLVQLANRRNIVAHAKGRSEVRGGGKKPWRQKGTGRARHGSIRSPLWKGGGVTHGPLKSKKYGRKINRKAKRLAVTQTLSKRLQDSELKIVDAFDGGISKTRVFAKMLTSITPRPFNALLVAASSNRNIHRMAANIPHIDAISARSLNVYDLLSHKHVILEKKAVEEIEKQYGTV